MPAGVGYGDEQRQPVRLTVPPEIVPDTPVDPATLDVWGNPRDTRPNGAQPDTPNQSFGGAGWFDANYIPNNDPNLPIAEGDWGQPDWMGRVWGDPGYIDPLWPIPGQGANGWNHNQAPPGNGSTVTKLRDGSWAYGQAIGGGPGTAGTTNTGNVHMLRGTTRYKNNNPSPAASALASGFSGGGGLGEPAALPVDQTNPGPQRRDNRAYFDTERRDEELFGNSPPRRRSRVN